MEEISRGLNEQAKEYITIERKMNDILQNELHYLRESETMDNFVKRIKNKEGFVFFTKGFYPKDAMGFVTSRDLEDRLNKFIEFHNKFEKLPKFIKYIINKL